jgi:hypothetical protein
MSDTRIRADGRNAGAAPDEAERIASLLRPLSEDLASEPANGRVDLYERIAELLAAEVGGGVVRHLAERRAGAAELP